ncbi:hypothetical protein [Nocardia sp. NPDC056000]|uniref:hypothetical protein n=1 Tax=Nocardia sp. NPDC056000 TaxID=3345674 RepID=UPI0035E06288
MGIKKGHRFPAMHDAAFEKGVLLLDGIEPVYKYNERRRAYTTEQDRDEVTGLLMWKARLMDLDADVKDKQAGVNLIFLAEVRPIPVGREWRPGVWEIELEGLTVEARASVAGDFATMSYTYRATGIKGDTSGAKQPPVDAPATRPVRSDKSAADKAVA